MKIETLGRLEKVELWPEQRQWLKEKLELFHKAFAPLVKNLD
jgi:hypothetical protein